MKPLNSRFARLSGFAKYIASKELIDAAGVKSEYSSEQPAWITRTLNELIRQGWLVEEDQKNCYRWNPGRGRFDPVGWVEKKLNGGQIKMSPVQERPREKLLAMGVERLSNSDLIAILIRSGRPGESAIQAAQKIAMFYEDRLSDLVSAGRFELKEISPAVEKSAFCQIMAGIELGRRIMKSLQEKKPEQIGGSSDAIDFCLKHFSRLVELGRQEEFHIVTLDTKHQVIATHQITVGTLDASLVHPREVFRMAIRDSAASILLVHNHPSGDPTPSRQDISVTDRLGECGELLGIDVLDHIVLGHNQAVSIRSLE